MILDYCRENKVAIHFISKDELDRICQLFTDGKYEESVGYIEGIVSFTRINISENVKWNYRCSSMVFSDWYKDYTIITAAEFFELANEQVSILEVLKD